MDGLPTNLPEDRDALIALLKEQQRQHQNQIAAKDKQLTRSEERNAQLRNSVQAKSLTRMVQKYDRIEYLHHTGKGQLSPALRARVR